MVEAEFDDPVEAGSTPASSGTGSWTIPNDLFDAFLSLLPDAALLVDDDGVVVSANDQAAPLFGYPKGALVGLQVDSRTGAHPAAASPAPGDLHDQPGAQGDGCDPRPRGPPPRR